MGPTVRVLLARWKVTADENTALHTVSIRVAIILIQTRFAGVAGAGTRSTVEFGPKAWVESVLQDDGHTTAGVVIAPALHTVLIQVGAIPGRSAGTHAGHAFVVDGAVPTVVARLARHAFRTLI